MWLSVWQTIFSGRLTWATRLAQQGDVMDAAQRMRKKAQDNGNLKSGEQQRVETKVIENKSVIVIEQSHSSGRFMYLRMTPWWFGVHPFTPTRRFTIPRQDTTPPGWRFRFGVG